MGNSEGEKPTKTEKVASPPREQSSVHVYPDWAAVQAYYGSGALPPPYFNPAATSGHAVPPYMWPPPQMMAPYGSPYAMYPHGGMYGPSAAPICMQIPAPLSLESPTKSSGKDSGSGKMTKESDVHAASGNGNANAESAGDAAAGVRGQSLSTDCGTEGSCERSYDSSAREDNSCRSCNGVLDTGTCNMQMNNVVPGIPMASVNPVGSSPANGVNSAAPCAPRQDEREQKREKRKQSNRESARRSRLRKQAEMEELGKKVDDLNVENLALRSEINKLVEDSEKLRTENSSLMDKLKIMQGQSDEMDSDRTENQETSHINTENLLSRVNNPVSNGVHEHSEEK
ncbi:G-box-binding factor 3-like isoform X1 [Chenopodium quinoa]|uniref:G-box-binding factor 3-like isoform X1 n=1 Tax=Chenopodium quinoa TaxID=63459 RepID=UPI000B77552C|nr:G-box-binding factor 3-like isoform X1 [Chenopodium quinoa]XP_021764943.1 G-box-binding factor 3-like isoform X1 [Chenopodium quinoa]